MIGNPVPGIVMAARDSNLDDIDGLVVAQHLQAWAKYGAGAA